jgi:hypothetical protein
MRAQLIPGKPNSYKTNPSRGYPISDIPRSTEILRDYTPPHDWGGAPCNQRLGNADGKWETTSFAQWFSVWTAMRDINTKAVLITSYFYKNFCSINSVMWTQKGFYYIRNVRWVRSVVSWTHFLHREHLSDANTVVGSFKLFLRQQLCRQEITDFVQALSTVWREALVLKITFRGRWPGKVQTFKGPNHNHLLFSYYIKHRIPAQLLNTVPIQTMWICWVII